MKGCTFFGHADAPLNIEPIIKKAIVDLIVNENDMKFYVGVEGQFDAMCYRAIKEIQKQYPKIRVYRVLAYMPRDSLQSEDSILPENIETVPKRFAIPWRNKWMIDKSAYVITYVNRPIGGAAKFEEIAIRRNKVVIKLAGDRQ